MNTLNEIPHLKTYRSTVSFPSYRRSGNLTDMTDDEKKMPNSDSARFSLVFLNSPSFEDSVETIQNTTIVNRGIHRYFLERSYHGKLFGVSYHENLFSKKIDRMKSLQGRSINPERNFSALRNANVFVDLYMYNEIFFESLSNGISFIRRVDGYLHLLKKELSKMEYAPYRMKTMLIDLRAWYDRAKDTTSAINNQNNPLVYIIYAMKRRFEEFKELGDIDLIFSANGMNLRLNPSKCDKTSYTKFQTEARKITVGISNLDSDVLDADELEEKEEETQRFLSQITDTGYRRLTGDKAVKQLDRTIDDVAKKAAEKLKEEEPKLAEHPENLSEMVEEEPLDDEMIKEISKAATNARVGQNKASSKRDEMLREKQREIKFHGKTFDEITQKVKFDVDRSMLIQNDISDKISTTNKNVGNVIFNNFEEIYNKRFLHADTAKIIQQLNNASIPVYVRKIDVEDTSNELSLKETYVVELEDANRVRHRLKFDMPKFIDDKFMYLNGSKKLIVKQLLLKPIVKTDSNTVKIVSNYNKIFIHRYGKNISSKITKMLKTLEKGGSKGLRVKYGKQLNANKDFITTIEYDEFAKRFESIEIGDLKLVFNIPKLKEYLEANNFPKMVGGSDQHILPIGFNKKTKQAIYLDTDSQMITSYDPLDGEDIVTLILFHSGQDFSDMYKEQTAGKKYVYTRARLMDKDVPILLLLGYVEGITTVLRKSNVKHYFSDTRPRVSEDQGVVQFEDGYLVFDRYPFNNSLLLNAFYDLPTRAYKFSDFDSKDAYLDIFDIKYNQRNIASGFDNFYDFLIDPITKEVLEDLDLPTTFVDVVLYAHNLLMDNDYTSETDMSLYRVRSNELLNVYLYKALAAAYRKYYNTAGNNNPTKISIPQDAITKEVLTAQTIEDYSTLNPIVEVEKSRAITPKGPAGINLSQAFTLEKRSYSESMVGLMAMSTSPDANVGVVRALTTEPSITSPRGYFDVKQDELDDLKDVNLFSPAELLSPLGASRDDTIRTAMAIKQSKHIVPIANASPVLISNGMEQALPYNLSTDYSIVAKEKGKVVEINEDTGIAIIEYDKPVNGEKHQAIEISPRVVKNGGGGFYLVNQLKHKLKVGQRFDKNDILAADGAFFSEDTDGVRFNIGALEKVAIMSSYATYEDSTVITQKLARDVAAKVTIPKEVSLGANSNVDYIVKVGDKVKVGDELMRFDTSFNDDSINKFLSGVGEDLEEEIRTLGKKPILSKYSGTVVDIKVYSTVDLDQLSPTLRALVSKQYNQVKKRKAVLNKYDKTDSVYKLNMHLTEPVSKIETKDGKVKGNIVGEGVLIQIFIEYEDVAGIGDKIAFFTALKSIVGEVIEPGYEPYALSDPDEEISAFIAPGAVLARMTPSILLTMFGNKVLVNLKRKLQEIYES